METGTRDAEKRARLWEQGFTVFPNVLSAEMRGRLCQVTDRKVDARDTEAKEATRAQGSLLWTNRDPLFAELVTLPRAMAALRALGFDAPTFSDGYIIAKEPHGPRLFWHYDWFAWEDVRSFEMPPPQVFVMYYLTDTRRENGCLRVIPGSHLRENPLHTVLANPHGKELSAASDLTRPEFGDRPDEVDVPVQAGDMIVGDARLLHAAHENRTDERRTLITLWYQPDLARLPERMQAQMAAKCHPIPDDWPAEARAAMDAVLANRRYTGDAMPYERSLWRKP